jgi:acyl-[acyl-carrier-protein]-phospholipid O-acyltransferase/long-chain-fatty-acid--[acyl-carrier-protein] ligase
VVELPDALKGSKIIAAVTQPVATEEILKQMARDLPPIALPRKFHVIGEFPKMGSGKIDFRTITETVRQAFEQAAGS